MKKYIVSFIIFTMVAALSLAALFYHGIIWFVNPAGMGYQVKGIDVARYQGDIDWQVIASQDIRFAFMKATEGSSYADPTFDVNITASREHGVYAGAYHFFSSESAGYTQAENFINTLSDYPMDLPPVLDFEIIPGTADKAAAAQEALVFLQEVENAFGVRPIIYTTYESYNAFLTDGFEEYPLWFRDLFREPRIAGGRDWVFWQYCNRGRLKGIDEQQKYVDLNVFFGDADAFEAYVQEATAALRAQ